MIIKDLISELQKLDENLQVGLTNLDDDSGESDKDLVRKDLSVVIDMSSGKEMLAICHENSNKYKEFIELIDIEMNDENSSTCQIGEIALSHLGYW